jgi:WXG100 family type VII secretion target
MSGPGYYGADGTIRYDFGEITDVATAIGTFEGQMDGSLNELYQEFRKLFAQDWQGQAGQACDQAQQKWSQGATEIKMALGQVGKKLGASAEQMQAVDQRIAAGLGG